MKTYLITAFMVLFAACNSRTGDLKQMQTTIDSLQSQLNKAYKPGLGEFMSGIQIHHAKLWFAGTNNNWALADFEINEIREGIEDIVQFNTDRPETKLMSMINPAIDSMAAAIKQQNQDRFRSSYTLLTNTCNNCHRAAKHEFNVIITPTTPPISNQSFKP